MRNAGGAGCGAGEKTTDRHMRVHHVGPLTPEQRDQGTKRTRLGTR